MRVKRALIIVWISILSRTCLPFPLSIFVALLSYFLYMKFQNITQLLSLHYLKPPKGPPLHSEQISHSFVTATDPADLSLPFYPSRKQPLVHMFSSRWPVSSPGMCSHFPVSTLCFCWPLSHKAFTPGFSGVSLFGHSELRPLVPPHAGLPKSHLVGG